MKYKNLVPTRCFNQTGSDEKGSQTKEELTGKGHLDSELVNGICWIPYLCLFALQITKWPEYGQVLSDINIFCLSSVQILMLNCSFSGWKSPYMKVISPFTFFLVSGTRTATFFYQFLVQALLSRTDRTEDWL